ncbi:MAG: Osmolarity sensor protein EnvZ [Herbaspirillum frisingense]|uniref:histidine kinase n=1 Tax=Herbaspirillum frisingense TaxID=92645 RepID=A0A7V8FVQ7_9BURK|nr:MAG: Osmolarity sensor protein EnvZ [Herbaspirillum frisingense]
MKLWPRTMAGQLVGLLLLGLVAAHAIGLSVVLTNGETIHSISRDQMVEHAAVAWRLGSLPEAQARSALETARHGNARYTLDVAPDIADGHEAGYDQEAIGGKLQSLLALPAAAVRISLVRHDARNADLRIALRTPGGLWVNTLQHPVMSQAWMRPLRFSVPVSTLPVLVIVFLFVRRILRPIKALAQAAERVSRGELVDPLPVTGPAEAREVTSAFNLMQERLRRFVEDRTRMLAAISHDLRTPITSLRLRAELVDDAPLKAAMIRTLEEMRVMVEETLRFARDDASTEDTREIDLRALLRDVVEEQRAQGRDVQLRGDATAVLPYRCRPVNLKRALSNLVDNAVHYGQRARLALSAGTAGALQIHVDDDGPGIAADKLQDVFKPFVRLDPSRHRNASGARDGGRGGHVGLGLAIARSCIEAHGGRLELENRGAPEHAHGLRAVVSLPA